MAHTLLHRVLPKGSSFDHLTQADIDLICSHINSYSRENLNGAYPLEVAPSGFCGDGLLNALGLKIIKPDPGATAQIAPRHICPSATEQAHI